MKNIFFITLLLLTVSRIGFSQSNGTTPEVLRNSSDSGTSRAVIIGISDYQNQDIPDLQFAHKDAAAFADYLKSPAGGSLTDEQLKVLLNENATTAQIAAALEWLVEVSKEGDQAVIYFSGHGDVETKTMFQLGYLLTWDSPARTYVAGAFPLSYLQAVVSTLSLQNKAEVALITDACRAGKLAGTNVGGAQITNANLSKQFASEVKILSCQPDEFSLEGEQWGGGRGVFSYHLLDGLYGLADSNEDFTVNLFEIGRYLEDKVSSEAAPHSQFPMIVGSKNTTMALVDETSLASLKEKRSREMPTLEVVESKGFEDMILTEVDSIWQKKYREFIAAVDEGRLLDSSTGDAAAYDLYVELSQAEELKKLHGTMQRNLAAALQDDAQQAINAYLAANPTELAKRYAAESDYGRHPRYLRKAAEILGAQNFYYPYVMAKLYYFEGLRMRLDADKGVENTSYEKAIEQQLKALEYQDYAPFVLNELGVLHTRLKRDNRAFDYYQKAIEIAPEWGLPYVNYSVALYYAGQQEQAINYGEMALKRMAEYPQVYNFLGWIYANYLEFEDLEKLDRRGLELKNDFVYLTDDWGTKKQKTLRFRRTVELLERALQLDSIYHSVLVNLGNVYLNLSKANEAILILKDAVRLDPHYAYSHLLLGVGLLSKNELEKAEQELKTAIELSQGKDSVLAAKAYCNLGVVYSRMNKDDLELAQYEQALALAPELLMVSDYLASYYARHHRNYAKTEEIYLRKLEPQHSPITYRALAELYYRMNRWDDAEKAYLEAIKQNPDYVVAIINLGRFYHKRKRFEKAEKMFKMAVEKSPGAWEYDWLGWFYSNNDRLEEAKVAHKKALDIDTTFNWSYSHLSKISFKQNNFDQAWDYLNKFTEKFPTYSIQWIIKEKEAIQIESKKYEEILKKRVVLAPHHRRPSMDLASWYENTDQIEKAEEVFQNYLALHPESVSAWDYIEHFYLKSGQSDKAISFLQNKLKDQPENLEIAIRLCGKLLGNLRFDEAKEYCPKQIKTDRPHLQNLAGRVYYQLGEVEKAQKYFDQYAESYRLKYWSYHEIGWFYYYHGDIELAKQYFLTSIKYGKGTKTPYYSYAWNYHDMAYLYYTIGQPIKAVEWIDKGLAHPNSRVLPNGTPILKLIIGFDFFSEADINALLKEYKSEEPELYRVKEFLVYKQQGDFEKAEQAYQGIMEHLDYWWLDYLKLFYLQIKIQQREHIVAMDIMEQTPIYLLPFHYLTNDPILLLLKDEPRYQTMLRKRFPEKFQN